MNDTDVMVRVTVDLMRDGSAHTVVECLPETAEGARVTIALGLLSRAIAALNAEILGRRGALPAQPPTP